MGWEVGVDMHLYMYLVIDQGSRLIGGNSSVERKDERSG